MDTEQHRLKLIDVPVIEDTFVVNIGQAFEVVSPGVCKATAQRILSSSLERYSVSLFQRVRGNLTEAVETLRYHFAAQATPLKASKGSGLDSPFLRGKYYT